MYSVKMMSGWYSFTAFYRSHRISLIVTITRPLLTWQSVSRSSERLRLHKKYPNPMNNVHVRVSTVIPLKCFLILLFNPIPPLAQRNGDNDFNIYFIRYLLSKLAVESTMILQYIATASMIMRHLHRMRDDTIRNILFYRIVLLYLTKHIYLSLLD